MADGAGGRDFNGELHGLVEGKANPGEFTDMFADAAAAGHAFDKGFLADRLARLLYLEYKWENGIEEQVNIMRQFLAAGLSPNARTPLGTPLLMAALVRPKPPVLAALLAAGADPNKPSARDGYALTDALGSYRPELIKFLLAHGADPSVARLPTGERFLDLVANGQHARLGEFAEPVPPHQRARMPEMYALLRTLASNRLGQVERNTKKLLQLREVAKKAGLPENVERGILKPMMNLETREPGISVQAARQLLAAVTRYEQSQGSSANSEKKTGGSRRKTYRCRGRSRPKRRTTSRA